MQAVYESANHDLYCRSCPAHGSNTLGYHSHLHYQIELAMVFSGRTRATVDSTEYEVSAGDVIVIFPNQIHDFRTVERESYILLKFSPDLIPELQKQVTSAIPLSNLIKNAASDPELRPLIEKIADAYYGNEPLREVILRGYLLVFFGKLLGQMELRDVRSGDYHAVGIIMNYCSNNYEKNLSLSVLEKELHLNRYYISHIMSEKLHIGFNDYINSLRISNACKYLLKGDKTVTEISTIVGFNTLRTFNRAFIKQMGCTPSEYRRTKQNERKTLHHAEAH